MQLRIGVAAHCGMGGHRGATAKKQIVAEKVTWPTMEADLDSFIKSYLVYHFSSGGQKVPRPLGHQEHVEKAGELLYFEFLYIGESASGHSYILLLKGDFSGYISLRPCVRADAESDAAVLQEYLATFLPILKWFSDQGPHFYNDAMKPIAIALGVHHDFSAAYVPWLNGTVEAVFKEVLRIMRAVSSEFQILETECLPFCQSSSPLSTTPLLGASELDPQLRSRRGYRLAVFFLSRTQSGDREA